MPSWLLATLALLAPALLGVLAGALSLFDEPERAIDNLNRFALSFAFPALIWTGIAGSDFGVPTQLGFWLVVPAALLVSVALARALAPRHASTLALVCAFGNVAYLGLPIVEQVLGAEVMGTASLATGIHVTLALTVGPYLLMRWDPGRADSASAEEAPPMQLLRQPLLWAPPLGFAAHALGPEARAAAVSVLQPLGRAAAPVALFVLGLYLVCHRHRLRSLGLGDALHVVFKLLAMPALSFALAWGAHRLGWLSLAQAQVLCLLSTMPAAITTFAIAKGAQRGTEAIARAIVLTTLVSGLTIPCAAYLVTTWLPTW